MSHLLIHPRLCKNSMEPPYWYTLTFNLVLKTWLLSIIFPEAFRPITERIGKLWMRAPKSVKIIGWILLAPVLCFAAVLLVVDWLLFFLATLVIKSGKPNYSLCKLETGTTASDATCSVCWDTLTSTDIILVHTKCKNEYHRGCLERWIMACDPGRQLCCLCREPVTHFATKVLPDGPDGHGWKPESVVLTAKQTCLVGAFWFALASTNRVCTWYGGKEIMPTWLENFAARQWQDCVSAAVQMVISTVIIKHCDNMKRQVRVGIWLAMTLCLSPAVGFDADTMINGYLRSVRILTEYGALVLNPGRDKLLH